MPHPEYRVVVADLNGNPIDEVPAGNLAYSHALNDSGNISFILPTNHEKVTHAVMAPGQREIHVYREGTKMWAGYLWSAVVDQEEARFAGSGYFSRLKRRYVDTDQLFTTIDQLDIAWDLIDFTQGQAGGDLGITRFNPTESSGVNRDRNYFAYERKNIGEALQQLAAVDDGFDFEITAEKEWKTYYPQKGSVLGTRLETGKNVRGISIDYDANDVASEISALGEGQGVDMVIGVATDADTRVDFGLLEDTRSFKDVSVQSTIDAHAEEELRLVKQMKVRPQPSLITGDPAVGGFAVGDEVRLTVNRGYLQVDQMFRITTISVSISNEGFEAYTLFFSEATLQ